MREFSSMLYLTLVISDTQFVFTILGCKKLSVTKSWATCGEVWSWMGNWNFRHCQTLKVSGDFQRSKHFVFSFIQTGAPSWFAIMIWSKLSLTFKDIIKLIKLNNTFFFFFFLLRGLVPTFGRLAPISRHTALKETLLIDDFLAQKWQIK